jgi:aromatic-L-amino-acid/L-tryptophan decarboxylase
MDNIEALRYRIAPLEMTESEFRKAGHQVIEHIAEWLCSLPNRPVAPNEAPGMLREAFGTGSLPEQGVEARDLLEEAATLLFEHSTFNGHPRFLAMITSSAAPIGALGDLLAAAVNPNVGGWALAPIATEMEAQTIRWIAELIDYPADCGGLLVSGGNMGNFIGFLVARTAKTPWDVRTTGLTGGEGRHLRVYSSVETHTWLHKAVDLFGLGIEAIRWIPVDAQLRMDTAALRRQIQADNEAGDLPFLVIGTAGTVSTGAVDPLPEIAVICCEYDLWFHVDGAYGGFAAALLNTGSTVEVPKVLHGISLADSVAVDPP